MSKPVHQPTFLENAATVRVVVPLALPKTLDYAWPEKTPPQPGCFVEVTVGKHTCHGLVEGAGAGNFKGKLKPARPLPMPPLAAPTAQFWQWAARYNMALPGDPLRAALMKGKVPEKPESRKFLRATGMAPESFTPQRRAVLSAARGRQFETLAALAEAAGVGAGVVSGLMKQGCLDWEETQKVAPPPPTPRLLALSKEQQRAADTVAEKLEIAAFHPFLLDGTMGSGKTEVYFQLVAEVLSQGKQSLILVPEIALTPQWISRFEARFGFKPALWHSGVGGAARRRAWWEVFEGRAKVIIGARSALFLPFSNLGLVVVDEEHDGSYKQEDVFRYNGRDMAVVLAKLWHTPVVLASATPSLETWHNVAAGRYTRLQIPPRAGRGGLPTLRTVNMCAEGPEKGKWLSPALKKAIERRLEDGEQSLLFLNRRGIAPVLWCRSCARGVECPRCDVTLAVHGERLCCHHCGFRELPPEVCPHCKGEDTLFPYGPGTRKIAEEVGALFPQARLAVADSDAINTPAKMKQLVEAMEAGKTDILIGTQMVTKGHHFPNLTLVGVIDADMGLTQGDLRAAERTFQLLTQVSGRAGREEKPGEVLLQTHDENHPLLQAIVRRDRQAFYDLEMAERKRWHWPPYTRLIGLILSGENPREVETAGRALATGLQRAEAVEVSGPAPAPLGRLNDQFRYRLLVKAKSPPQAAIQPLIAGTPLPKGVRLVVDVDPLSFL